MTDLTDIARAAAGLFFGICGICAICFAALAWRDAVAIANSITKWIRAPTWKQVQGDGS